MKLLSEEMLTEMARRKAALPPSLQDEDLKGMCLLPFRQILDWVKRVQVLEKLHENKKDKP